MQFQSKTRVEKVVKVPVGEQTSRLGEKECGNIWLRSLSRLHHRILSTSSAFLQQVKLFAFSFNSILLKALLYQCMYAIAHACTSPMLRLTNLKTELIILCCHKCLR